MNISETPFTYGSNGAGRGMLTHSYGADGPLVVLFNAGLISREGPYRLNVLLARSLAACGARVLRVDLSGKGDSPARSGMSNRASVAQDWGDIKHALRARFGPGQYILGGLCSGADNAIKLCAADQDVVGLMLLDPIVAPDAGFRRRYWQQKLIGPHVLPLLWSALWQRALKLLPLRRAAPAVIDKLRDVPAKEDMARCFKQIQQVDGRVIAVFSGHALDSYNQPGQFARGLEISGIEACIEEVFWPQAQHLYPIAAQRQRLIEQLSQWYQQHFAVAQQRIAA